MSTPPEPIYTLSLSETGAEWKIAPINPPSADVRVKMLAESTPQNRFYESQEAAAKELIALLVERRQEALKQFNKAIASIGTACGVQEEANLASTHRFPLATASGTSSFIAEVGHPVPNYEYQEVSVAIFDGYGEMVADVLIGLHDETIEPRISLTTDANGMGDKNVVVYPLRPATEAVEVDQHNSQIYRQSL